VLIITSGAARKRECLRASFFERDRPAHAWRRIGQRVSSQRPSTVRFRTSLFEEARSIVEAEYASDLALDALARRLASSRRQLQRAYSEIGRTTFREHLTNVRMDRAAELLAANALTVREVAHRVGYRQPAQFAKAFRRHQGIAPSAYRADARPYAQQAA
jgi:AraC family transcriptional regulator, regulatory protein of adaptative response / methylphosphotriester-DNA alkyltransferase methyltransferase